MNLSLGLPYTKLRKFVKRLDPKAAPFGLGSLSELCECQKIPSVAPMAGLVGHTVAKTGTEQSAFFADCIVSK